MEDREMVKKDETIYVTANDGGSGNEGLLTLRQIHHAAVRNVPMNSPKENAWFRWWLFRGGMSK